MDKTALQILEQHSIRPSVQRIEVVSYLYHNRIHPTADEIFNALNGTIPTLSKTTIYNILKLLEDGGVVKHINIDEKNVRYELIIGEHAHFRCDNCSRIFDIPAPTSKHNLPEGFTIRESDTYYHGICPECSKKPIV